MSCYLKHVESDGYHIPAPLKEYDVWVVWSPELGKTARAPWQEGHMYPAEWAEDKPVDPRTTFNQASATATLPLNELANRYPFPPDTDPETVEPTILIPPKGSGNDLLFVDFDDVVNPDGSIPGEVWEIVERLGGYTEISRSGDGLHVWVRGSLPDGYGKVIEPLDTQGQLEMYDRGRMTGCTWRHVEGTPKDAIPERTDVVADLVEQYETKTCPECEEWTRARDLDDESPECPECGATFDTSSGDAKVAANHTTAGDSWNGDDNPYYQLDVTDVADTGAFGRYRNAVENPAHDDWQGPHPKHGGTSTKDAKSTNFNVDPSEGVWHCFAHGTGGGALSLIAVLEGIVSCRNASKVHRDRKTLLKACLAAREKYTTDLDGETPPYAALVAVAELTDLEMADPESGRLGRVAHSYASDIYDAIDSYQELTDL